MTLLEKLSRWRRLLLHSRERKGNLHYHYVFRAPKGGMDNILAAMKKPKKMSVLDKSSHDWNKLVAKEGIAEELSQHNKSKGSYLDKQKFLNSVDQAKFLKEKEARDKNRIPL